jgi:hypothetical protein
MGAAVDAFGHAFEVRTVHDFGALRSSLYKHDSTASWHYHDVVVAVAVVVAVVVVVVVAVVVVVVVLLLLVVVVVLLLAPRTPHYCSLVRTSPHPILPHLNPPPPPFVPPPPKSLFSMQQQAQHFNEAEVCYRMAYKRGQYV